MYPKPRPEVLLHWVEKIFHGVPNLRYHILKLGMIHPMLSSIKSQGECRKPLFVHVFVQLEQNCKAGLCQERVRMFQGNVVLSDVLDVRCLKAIGGQEFFDREVRKLYNFRTLVIGDDGDESGTCGKHRFLRIFRSPVFHKMCRVRAKLDCEYFCEFFSTKWPNSCDQALEEPMGMLPFLFRDALQNPLVRFIQSDGQFVQGFSNT